MEWIEFAPKGSPSSRRMYGWDGHILHEVRPDGTILVHENYSAWDVLRGMRGMRSCGQPVIWVEEGL